MQQLMHVYWPSAEFRVPSQRELAVVCLLQMRLTFNGKFLFLDLDYGGA